MQKEFNSLSNMQNSSAIDINKYLRLIKRKKLLIIVTFICVFIISIIFLLQFGPKPEYTASAILQLNDTRRLSGVEEGYGRQQNDSKIAMIQSRKFLSEVVELQSLAVKFKSDLYFEIVDSVKLKNSYQSGDYLLQKENDKLQLFFTSFDKTIENRLLVDGKFPTDFHFKHNGLDLYFTKEFWTTNDKLEYSLITKRNAVEQLRLSLTPIFRDPREQTIMEVSLSGANPVFVANTLNALVDNFVEKNIDNKKYYTREVVNILTKQLKTAKIDLDAAVEDLTRYREKNPRVGLTATTVNTVDEISIFENQKLVTKNKLVELKSVLDRFNSAKGEEKYPILNEIISFLSAQAVPTIPALSSEFLILNTERTNMLSSFAEGHPVLEENKKKLNTLESKVLLTAENQKKYYEAEILQQDSKINLESNRIQKLPAKEMEFAELTRKRNVADQVYSSLLVRLNQAKVSDAVEVGDIIVLDYAVSPLREGFFVQFLRYFGISLLLGLVVSFGTVFVGDIFDKTVRTQEELKKIVSFRVVAKIPIIGSEKEVMSEVFDGTKRVDSKLVTADYSPTAMGEEYRSLRTQILFSTNQRPIRSIFVTSLSPNDGKSLNAANLAITFAQQKIPTLLVDADLRRGVLHNSFACKKKPGLSDFLYSHADINDENIQKVIQQTHIPNLYLMTSGIPVPNPSEILGSQRGKDIIKFLSDRFGFLVVDTPPIMVTTDSVVISKYVDIGLFVVRAGKTNIDSVKNKISEYEDFHERIFGIVLNCAETDTYKESYKYSYYNY